MKARLKIRRLIIAAFALLAAGCATSPQAPLPAQSAAQSAQDLTHVVRLDYDRGFDQLASLLPERSDGQSVAGLEKIKDFRQRWVRWGELSGNKVRALGFGYRPAAWMIVVPPGHAALDRMVATLQVDAQPSATFLLVKPERVSERWAGIFLVHELSHLMDRADGVEPLNPSREQYLLGELRAYQAETDAAQLLSDGALQREMDRLIAQWRPASADALVAKLRDIDATDWAALEKAMGSAAPASEAELGMRAGFYAMAISLRYTHAHAQGTEEMLRVIEQAYADYMSLKLEDEK